MNKRENQDVNYLWNLSLIYENESQIKADMSQVEFLTQLIIESDFERELLVVLDTEVLISTLLSKMYTYAHLKLDEDHVNSKSIELMNLVKEFYIEISTKLSFIEPKLSKLNLEELLLDEKFKSHFRTIEKTRRARKYILSEIEENIISQSGKISSTAYDIYTTFITSDLKFDDIDDSNNNINKLSESNYSTYLMGYDRVLRKNAFEELLTTYKQFNNTFATIYLSHLKKSSFYTNVRGYENSLNKALFKTEIDKEIYNNLIASVNKNLSYNHKYLKMRKDIMKLDKLNIYDVYCPLIENIANDYSYEDGFEIVTKSLEVLGTEYVSNVIKFKSLKYIDVYPNENKQTGAYSSGSYNTPPYILLNYTNTLNDVFTLTHEIGHSMHSLLSNENQQYQNSNYKIFVAEIASTVNELLLFKHMYDNTDDVKLKMNLLNYNLEQFRTTVYRQTMFAEFELKSNELYEKEGSLSADVLNEMYLKLNQTYFSDEVEINDLIKYEWSRIPHFYYDYYVYQYATSFCIATFISEQIYQKDEKVIANYLDFLSSGDSMDPVSLIEKLNIDVKSEELFNQALKVYDNNIDKLESLMKDSNE